MDASLLFHVPGREDIIDGLRERDFRLDADLQPLGIVDVVAIRGNANPYPTRTARLLQILGRPFVGGRPVSDPAPHDDRALATHIALGELFNARCDSDVDGCCVLEHAGDVIMGATEAVQPSRAANRNLSKKWKIP